MGDVETIEAAIIGGGPSGLTAAREFMRRGIEASCFEAGGQPAPTWSSSTAEVATPVYDSLRLNNSVARMRIPGTRLKATSRPFATATEFHHYLMELAEDMADRVRLGRRLVKAEHTRAGWRLSFATGETAVCSNLVVATGMCAVPRPVPELEAFHGQVLHAGEYRRPASLSGARVLVVGAGNSGAEIASELAVQGVSVELSIRGRVHIVPRTVFGMSADRLDGPLISRLPLSVRQRLHDVALGSSIRTARRSVLRPPDTPLLRSAWTISSDLLAQVTQGSVRVRSAVSGSDGTRVTFADGSGSDYDVVIAAVGYTPDFAALPSSPPITSGANGCYLKIVPPDTVSLPNAFFLSFCLPLGALLPVAAAQARWTAKVIGGDLSLPGAEALRLSIARDARADAERFNGSRSPTILVDPYPYIRRLDAQSK